MDVCVVCLFECLFVCVSVCVCVCVCVCVLLIILYLKAVYCDVTMFLSFPVVLLIILVVSYTWGLSV